MEIVRDLKLQLRKTLGGEETPPATLKRCVLVDFCFGHFSSFVCTLCGIPCVTYYYLSILFQRRSNDPRERVRKEQDGIVLSPQRRSFNSGCFVPTSQASVGPGRRPESPIGKPERYVQL